MTRYIYSYAWTPQTDSSYTWVAGFQGLMLDFESRLVYARWRFYQAALGAWLSRDPLEIRSAGLFGASSPMDDPPATILGVHLLGAVGSGGALYQFESGDPLSQLDPLGLNDFKDCWKNFITPLPAATKQAFGKQFIKCATSVGKFPVDYAAILKCMANQGLGAGKTAAAKLYCCFNGDQAFPLDVETSQDNIQNCQTRCAWQECQDFFNAAFNPNSLIGLKEQQDTCNTGCCSKSENP
jgi:RHS repeat-associated protein